MRSPVERRDTINDDFSIRGADDELLRSVVINVHDEDTRSVGIDRERKVWSR